MICDHCEEEIVGEAVCLDCLEIAIFENQVKKTPLELAAGDLLKMCKGLIHRANCMLQSHQCVEHTDSECCDRVYMLDMIQESEEIITKAQDNPSPQPNPAEPDECKSAE